MGEANGWMQEAAEVGKPRNMESSQGLAAGSCNSTKAPAGAWDFRGAISSTNGMALPQLVEGAWQFCNHRYILADPVLSMVRCGQKTKTGASLPSRARGCETWQLPGTGRLIRSHANRSPGLAGLHARCQHPIVTLFEVVV